MSRRLRVVWGAYRLLPVKTSQEMHHHTTKYSDDPAERNPVAVFLWPPSSVKTEKFQHNSIHAHNTRCEVVVSYCSTVFIIVQIIDSVLPFRGPGVTLCKIMFNTQNSTFLYGALCDFMNLRRSNKYFPVRPIGGVEV
jgi:hypothetical protein